MARKVKGSETTLSVDPREIFEKHMKLILPLRRSAQAAVDAQREANSAVRTALKAAGKEGVDLKALARVFEFEKMEIADLDQYLKDTNNYLLWRGIPVGTQMGLFKDGSTIASVVDNERIAEQTGKGKGKKGAVEEVVGASAANLALAYGRGKDAAVKGLNLSDATAAYQNPANAKLKSEAERGWADGQEERAMSMGGSTRTPPAHDVTGPRPALQ